MTMLIVNDYQSILEEPFLMNMGKHGCFSLPVQPSAPHCCYSDINTICIIMWWCNLIGGCQVSMGFWLNNQLCGSDASCYTFLGVGCHSMQSIQLDVGMARCLMIEVWSGQGLYLPHQINDIAEKGSASTTNLLQLAKIWGGKKWKIIPPY